MDWFANGLPREGRHADHPRAGDMLRRDVPTCRLHDTVHDIAVRMRATRWDLCVVLNEEQRGEASTPAEPHLTLDDLGTRLKKRDHLAVTTTAGRFLGVVLRSDVERKMIEREHFVKN